MSKNHFNATTLRTLLLVCVVLLAAVVVGGFYFASNWLSNTASDTKTKNYTAVSDNLSSNEIIRLQDDVNSHMSTSIKATSLIASDQGLSDIVRKDINKYAADIGISITDFGPTQKPSFMTTDVPVANVKSEFFTVSLGSPIPFAKLYEFIVAIESNTPKMKLTGISMGSVPGQNGSVSVKPIIIEAYAK